MNPARDRFYASSDNEQKARFNRLGQEIERARSEGLTYASRAEDTGSPAFADDDGIV